MKSAHAVTVLLPILVALAACSGPTPALPQSPAANADQTPAPSGTPSGELTPQPSSEQVPTQSAAPAVQTPSATPPSTPQATSATLALEVAHSQSWSDHQGNARANVVFRNPYEFPVQVTSSGATLVGASGQTIKSGTLYFLDGISGGSGYFLPGESIAATSCFTCEQALLTEEWASVAFTAHIMDATDERAYSTEVAATGVKVTFDGNSPIFWLTGKATNTSASALDRISVRVFVFDKDGNLIGAAESSGWEVPAGDSVELTGGYGLGENPKGPFDIEVTALGVDYDNF